MMTATPALSSAPEQRRAVGGDERLADQGGQLRIVGDADDLDRVARQRRCRRRRSCACTIGLTSWPLVSGDVSTWAIQAMVGASCATVLGHGGQDDAVLVLLASRAAMARSSSRAAAEFELPGRAGIGGRVLVGLGVDADVAAKAVEQG